MLAASCAIAQQSAEKWRCLGNREMLSRTWSVDVRLGPICYIPRPRCCSRREQRFALRKLYLARSFVKGCDTSSDCHRAASVAVCMVLLAAFRHPKVRARQATFLDICVTADDEVPALEGPIGDTEGTDSTKSHRKEPEAAAPEAGFSCEKSSKNIVKRMPHVKGSHSRFRTLRCGAGSHLGDGGEEALRGAVSRKPVFRLNR